ncbi:hypothetical protein Bca52824_060041 [Brassica carinata]|uniref:Uncharacterized protein n=1 Tax=Brassica carinata TaxID=52824 RepID=A0A8X7UH88_BRACI|nr:hypothetical protein Bca52824_060041 [Brassica carinata]
MVISSQEKSQRTKPLFRLETSLHTTNGKRRQVDTSTTTYYLKDESHNRDFDKDKPSRDQENKMK